MEICSVKQISKIYKGIVSYEALSGIDLSIQQGEFVGIMGRPAVGKQRC